MRARAEWLPETIDMFSAAVGLGRNRRFLVVERLPDGDWDWVTWSGDRGAAPLQGRSVDPKMAMHEAERAADLVGHEHGGWSPRIVVSGELRDDIVLAFEAENEYFIEMQTSGWANAIPEGLQHLNT